MIFKMRFALPITSFLGTSLDFSPILLAPSARTNSPPSAPNRFSDMNTSSTVDPGFISSTSRNRYCEVALEEKSYAPLFQPQCGSRSTRCLEAGNHTNIRKGGIFHGCPGQTRQWSICQQHMIHWKYQHWLTQRQ